MGVSHIAIAVKDIHATHRFYTEAMGFELVKTEIVPKEGRVRPPRLLLDRIRHRSAHGVLGPLERSHRR